MVKGVKGLDAKACPLPSPWPRTLPPDEIAQEVRGRKRAECALAPGEEATDQRGESRVTLSATGYPLQDSLAPQQFSKEASGAILHTKHPPQGAGPVCLQVDAD